MRQLGFAPLAVLFVVLTAAGSNPAVPVEQPAAAQAFALEASLTCPYAAPPDDIFGPPAPFGGIFGPLSYSCQVDADCCNYCCSTYGPPCGGYQCSPRGICLC